MSHEHFHSELPRPNKGGMGRKKIEIKRIDEAKNRQVTFNKRKVGLIKKAIELSILCDCDMIMYVIHNGRVYQYRSTNPEDVLRLVAKNDAYESFTNSDLVNGHLRRHKKKRISMSSQSSHSTASQDPQQSPMFMPTPVNMAVAAANAANGHISMNHMDIHGHRGSTTSLPSPAMMNPISITKSPMQRSYQQQSPNFHGLTNLQLPNTQGYVQVHTTTSPNGTLSPSSSSSTVSTSSTSSAQQHMNHGMNSPMYPSYQQSTQNYVPSSSPTFSPTPNQQRRYSNPNIMMPPYDLTAPHFATYPNVQQPTPRHAQVPSSRQNSTTSYQPLASPQNNGYIAPNPTKRRRTSSTSAPQGSLNYQTTLLPTMDLMNHDLLRRTSLTEQPPAFESLDTLSSIATTSRTSPTPMYTQHISMKKRGREEDIKTEEEMNHHSLDL